MVQSGQFREDLYYRLNVVSIEMPPLRERKDDIVPLANSFIRRFAGELKKKIEGLEPDAQKLLMRYNWPGNIRELENTIERAMLLSEGRAIGERRSAPRGDTDGGSRARARRRGEDPADGHSARGHRAACADRSAEDVELGAEGRRGAAGDQPARHELQDQDARHRVSARPPRPGGAAAVESTVPVSAAN